ncbi:MAG: glycosyltransferase family 4 protein [Chloroflexi bacterium]|nr:glycosyltransferase family 4 protein [Chloroflexota bacterium]
MSGRLLMTTDAVGGVWTYALDLLTGLAGLDIEVHLAVMGPVMSADQRDQLRDSPVASVHEGCFALEWMEDPWADVQKAADWLRQLEADVRPEVVHVNGFSHVTAGWSAPTICVAHSCVLSWWRAVRGVTAPASWDEYRRRVGAGLAAADALVAPTRWMLAELARDYGAAGGLVIANGRDASWVKPTPKEPIVLGAGRVWDAAKNIVQLDRAASLLPWQVVIAGDERAPGRSASRSGRSSINSGRTVGWVGRLSFQALADLLLKAAIFVAPARYEPFGLGPLEAGLAGCALVLGDIPSLREVWGDSALYVDPADEHALAATICELISDGELRRERSLAARRRAATYSVQAMADRYAALYSELLAPSEVVA